MAKYAVIRVNGHQYKVTEGQEILVDKVNDVKNINPEVLLVVDEAKVEVGTPVVKEAKVVAKVIKELEKGEKIDVVTFKHKARFRKKKGHRHQYTRLQISKIS